MIVPQVAIVKAANVGSRLAQHLIKKNLANAVLLDVLSVHPQAIATYLQEQSGLNGYYEQH